MTTIPGWAEVAFLAAATLSMLVLLLWAAQWRWGQPPRSGLSLPRRTLGAVGRPWVLMAAAALLIVWGLTLAGAPKLAPGWKSTAVVAFTPRDPLHTDAETLTLLGPRYVALLESPALLRDAAEKTGTTEDDLRSGVHGEIEPDTLVLRVQFSGDTATESAEGANALASAITRSAAEDPLVRARMIAGAVVPLERTSPSMDQIVGLGWGAGLLVAVFVGVRTRRRWR